MWFNSQVRLDRLLLISKITALPFGLIRTVHIPLPSNYLITFPNRIFPVRNPVNKIKNESNWWDLPVPPLFSLWDKLSWKGRNPLPSTNLYCGLCLSLIFRPYAPGTDHFVLTSDGPFAFDQECVLLSKSSFYSPSPFPFSPASLHSSLFSSESFWSLFATTTKLFPLGPLVTSLEKLWLPSSLQQWQKLPEINSLGTGIFHHIKTFVTTTTEHGSRGHYQQQKLPTINGWTALCGNWKKHSLCA